MTRHQRRTAVVGAGMGRRGPGGPGPAGGAIGTQTVRLISDGEGDGGAPEPCRVAEELVRAGVGLRIGQLTADGYRFAGRSVPGRCRGRRPPPEHGVRRTPCGGRSGLGAGRVDRPVREPPHRPSGARRGRLLPRGDPRRAGRRDRGEPADRCGAAGRRPRRGAGGPRVPCAGPGPGRRGGGTRARGAMRLGPETAAVRAGQDGPASRPLPGRAPWSSRAQGSSSSDAAAERSGRRATEGDRWVRTTRGSA